MEPRKKAEEYIKLQRENIIRPLDDVNLSPELSRQRTLRMLIKNLNGNEFLEQMENLLKDAPISDFLKQQLVFESGLEEITGWTSWGELKEKFIKDALGISLAENKYGIFDPDSALAAEAKYFTQIMPLLEHREKVGQYNPISYKEWGKDLFKRVREKM